MARRSTLRLDQGLLMARFTSSFDFEDSRQFVRAKLGASLAPRFTRDIQHFQNGRLSGQPTETKTEYADNDVITDDMAGKAYIEQFGLETFQRADNAVRADKATRQTADTFQAASTFLELMQIWGPLDLEISSKIKYAKYHALRIAKAIKAGEDPNLSNPKQEQPQPDEAPLDANELDVQMLNDATKPRQPSVVEVPDEADHQARTLARQSVIDESLHPSRTSSVPRPPPTKVEDAPDDSDRLQQTLAQRSSVNESLHPSRAPSVGRPLHTDMTQSPTITRDSDSAVSPLPPATAEDFYTQSGQPDVSPLAPSPERRPSAGGNYFPQVQDPPSQLTAPPPIDLPSAPTGYSNPAPPAQSPLQDPSHAFSPSGPVPPPSVPPPVQQNQAPPPPPQTQPPPPTVFQPSHGPPPAQFPISPPTGQPYPPPPLSQVQPPSRPPPAQQPKPMEASTSFEPDEEAVSAAQKHARWAISALNFEDVPTAIKELRGALKSLGAG
ncbi:MAG: hypothetical protein Q9227_007305 [Pyrenula ochraceoflavens]